MLETPSTEHRIRFVPETATKNDPVSGLEDKLVTGEGVLLSDLMEVKSEAEGEEKEDIVVGNAIPCSPHIRQGARGR